MTHAPGFYVSVIDGPRYKLVAGPFETHAEALAQVGARAYEMVRPGRALALVPDGRMGHGYRTKRAATAAARADAELALPKVSAAFWSIEAVPGPTLGIYRLHAYGSAVERDVALEAPAFREGSQRAITLEQVADRCRAQTTVIDHRDGFRHNGLDYVR